jgi:DeoR/GlpR family transcriptional regulator of sugar metabolism
MSWQAKELGIDLDALKREAHRMGDDYIGVAVAANRYNVSTQTIYRYITDRKLIAITKGGRLWLSESELRRVFARRRAEQQ